MYVNVRARQSWGKRSACQWWIGFSEDDFKVIAEAQDLLGVTVRWQTIRNESDAKTHRTPKHFVRNA